MALLFAAVDHCFSQFSPTSWQQQSLRQWGFSFLQAVVTVALTTEAILPPSPAAIAFNKSFIAGPSAVERDNEVFVAEWKRTAADGRRFGVGVCRPGTSTPGWQSAGLQLCSQR